MSKDTHNISRRCCSVNVHDVTQEGHIFSLCRHYLNPKKQCWYSPSQKSLEQSHFPSFLLLSLFLLSCAVPCMPFHNPARWVFPVSAGLLLYVALFDWFDDLWPDCPSGHSRVHLAVYCIFFFAVTEFLLLLSASDLQTILLCLLNGWKERMTSCCQFHPVPSPSSVFSQNAPVP